MTNMAKVAFEAVLGIIFCVMAASVLSDPTITGQFTGVGAVILPYLPLVLLAIYLFGLAKSSGIISGK